MGKVIDATGIFRMRRLECDVERAERTPQWGTSVLEATQLASKQMEFNDIIRSNLDKIILPRKLKED